MNSREFDVAPRREDSAPGHDRQAEEHERSGHLLVPEEISRHDDEVRQALEHRHLHKTNNSWKRRHRTYRYGERD